MGWTTRDGVVLPWVLTCIQCTRRSGQDWTFGLDENRRLVGPVEAFLLEGDVSCE